jgi:uncharacterized protein YdaU (DUF1376 family)
MTDPWTAFYWADYIGDTGHLSLAQHGAYLLLMAHYYRTRRPLPSEPAQLYRICRAFGEEEQSAVRTVVSMFFTLTDQNYRHKRIDSEIGKQKTISGEYRARAKRAAAARWQKNATSNAPSMPQAMLDDAQSQSQSQIQPPRSKAKARARAPFKPPSLADVKAFCEERHNQVDPEQWVNYYTSNGWRVGRNPMKNWQSAVKSWEGNGLNHANRTGRNRAQQRQDDNLAALNAAFPVDR